MSGLERKSTFMFAIAQAHRLGLFAKNQWLNNILSGVVVGVLALPLAMAFAIASGLKPEQGLYTAIIAGGISSLFGGSLVQISGPTGAFIVILAGITAEYGVDGLQIATLLAGLILIGFSLLKFGSFIKFIPAPVIVGFTSGIGVIICFSQWQNYFGLPKVVGDTFFEKLMATFLVLPQFSIQTTLLATMGLLIILLVPKIRYIRSIPAPLTALVLCTVFQIIFKLDNVATIGSQFGGIPLGLPQYNFPSIQYAQVVKLMEPAFTIALLGAIESLMSAVVADGITGHKHEANQELLGQGLANLIAPLFGGFASTGAIARTATNIRYGGTSPLSGIIHCLVLVGVILFLAPLASHVPLCVLSAILFVVAYNMFDLPHFTHILKFAPRSDVIILLVTFLLTIFMDLVVAVNIGMIIAMLDFFRRMTATVDVKTQNQSELNEELHEELPKLPSTFMIYTIEGPFFFGAVEKLESALLQTHTEPKVILIRLGHVPFIDITALEVLENVIKQLHKKQVQVMLSEANPKVLKKLKAIKLLSLIGENNYHNSVSGAINYFNQNLK